MFGFIGKELLYKTKLDLETLGGWLVVAAVVANVALVATAFMVAVRPFLGRLKPTPKSPHEAPVSMVLGPVVLAIAGLGVFVPQAFETALGSGAASAIAGQTLTMDLKLWHGLNTDALRVMGLSLLTLAAGAALYAVVRRGFARAAAGVVGVARWGPERLFERAMEDLPTSAGWLTRQLQNGLLRHYLLVSVVAAVLVSLPSLLMWTARTRGLSVNLPNLFAGVLVFLVVASALVAVLLRSRLASVAALGVTGLAVALVFLLFSAPDLAMTQVMVETLAVILLVLVFARLPKLVRRSTTFQRIRDMGVAAALGLTMALLVLVSTEVAREPSASNAYLEASVPEAKGRNVVNVILVDFRALDTLGEITVVAVAGFGVAALIGWRFGNARRRHE
jgi:multicomponent Na+:H+ antiporter subunit A